jgi:hypothetical protein
MLAAGKWQKDDEVMGPGLLSRAYILSAIACRLPQEGLF